jgi:hypothetical protein
MNESNYKRNKLKYLFDKAAPTAESFESSAKIIKKCKFND